MKSTMRNKITSDGDAGSNTTARIVFGRAKEKDIDTLVKLYEKSWNHDLTGRQVATSSKSNLDGNITEFEDKKTNQKIIITPDQLLSQIRTFPEGQIVGYEDGIKPVSMINILLGIYDSEAGFPSSYSMVSGNKTFSNHLTLAAIREITHSSESLLPVAYCVSIAVDKAYKQNGLAHKTLSAAINFIESLDIGEGKVVSAIPFSAPRGFGAAFEKAAAEANELSIIDYLHLTLPLISELSADPEMIVKSYHSHRARLVGYNESDHRICRAFNGEIYVPAYTEFDSYAFLKEEYDLPFNQTAYGVFLDNEAKNLERRFKRKMTIEDFVLLSGRKMFDPVMHMHVVNGARFIRNSFGEITGIFENSRVEDVASMGYNILLSYNYHPLFGHFTNID